MIKCTVCEYEFPASDLIEFHAADYDGVSEEFEGVRIEGKMIDQDCLDMVTE